MALAVRGGRDDADARSQRKVKKGQRIDARAQSREAEQGGTATYMYWVKEPPT